MRRLSPHLLVVATLALGCVTPSIPIPPPEPEKMTFSRIEGGDTASFQYDPDPDYGLAVVYVFNRSRGIGVIDTARADGSVGPTQPFDAGDGDEVVVTFEADGELGSTCVRFAEGPSSPSRECGL
jgi:hypothetical protein